MPSQLWLALDFSLITHDNVGSQSPSKGLASWSRPYVPGARGGSCYAVQRFKWCSYKAFSWWQLKINSSNPDSKFWVNSGPFAWHWSEFPNGFFLCLCVCALIPIWFWSQKRKKTQNTNKQTSLRTRWNPSWLMVYFALWGRASTSCVCSKKSFFPHRHCWEWIKKWGESEHFQVMVWKSSCFLKCRSWSRRCIQGKLCQTQETILLCIVQVLLKRLCHDQCRA